MKTVEFFPTVSFSFSLSISDRPRCLLWFLYCLLHDGRAPSSSFNFSLQYWLLCFSKPLKILVRATLPCKLAIPSVLVSFFGFLFLYLCSFARDVSSHTKCYYNHLLCNTLVKKKTKQVTMTFISSCSLWNKGS